LRKYLQQLEQGTGVEKEGPLPMNEIKPDKEDMTHDMDGQSILSYVLNVLLNGLNSCALLNSFSFSYLPIQLI
jgi:hypothetical protein